MEATSMNTDQTVPMETARSGLIFSQYIGYYNILMS